MTTTALKILLKITQQILKTHFYSKITRNYIMLLLSGVSFHVVDFSNIQQLTKILHEKVYKPVQIVCFGLN